jgi:RNase P subunit RPR2
MRLACQRCNSFILTIDNNDFIDSTRHSDFYEILHIHCHRCHHHFDLRIG